MGRAGDRRAERTLWGMGRRPTSVLGRPNPAVLDRENKVGFSRRPTFRDFSSWSAIGRTNR